MKSPHRYFAGFRLAALALNVALATLAADAAETPIPWKRTEDLIYGRKFGTALTLDVFEPANRQGNDASAILVVSGGFFSAKEQINPQYAEPLLARGYTVFAVVHGSQPKFTIPEIQQDLHRAVRWIRHNAARWAVNPDKFAVFGRSAGGHLSLVLGTQGGPGPSDAKDPVDRASSAVQAVACFFPATDYSNWGEPGEDAVGVGRLANFKPAFGPRSDTPEGRAALSREISPLHFVTSKTAPTFIIHGDADTLVPIYQAKLFQKRCAEAGVPFSLLVREGKDHGWIGIEQDFGLLADWFDRHLRSPRQGDK